MHVPESEACPGETCAAQIQLFERQSRLGRLFRSSFPLHNFLSSKGHCVRILPVPEGEVRSNCLPS